MVYLENMNGDVTSIAPNNQLMNPLENAL
jgi:hypothetical protein